MKMIDELRQRQAFEVPKKSSPFALVLGALAAFGFGLLVVGGITHVSALFPPKTQMVPVAPRGEAPPAATDGSAPRIGRAETAPLLKACVPLAKKGLPAGVQPADLYRLLHNASSMSRMVAIAGIKPDAGDHAHFALLWAKVADCIYRQNGWVFCDPDNRAFAVEAAGNLLRQLSTAAKTETTGDGRETRAARASVDQRTYALQNAKAAKSRVLSGLRTQVADGRLTFSDFGFFAPVEIAQILRDTKVERNGCATPS